jgi:protein SCO1
MSQEAPPQSRRASPLRFALLLLAGVLALAAGALIWRGLNGPHEQPLLAAVDLRHPEPLPAFTLMRPDGKAYGNADLVGHWSILFFGYTYCPDICPTALATLVQMRHELVRRGVTPPQVVFISVDPERDRPEVLRQYASAFDPAFLSVSGTDAALAPLVKYLGVYYFRHDKNTDPHYVVDHSAGLYLIDPQGRWRAFYPPPQEGLKLATDFVNLSTAP